MRSIVLSIPTTLFLFATCAFTGCGSGGGGDSSTPAPTPPTPPTVPTSSLGELRTQDLGYNVSATITGTTVTLWNLGSYDYPHTTSRNTASVLMQNVNDTANAINTAIWPAGSMLSFDVLVNGTKRATFTASSGLDFKSRANSKFYRQYYFLNSTFTLTTAEAAALPDITFKITGIAPNTSISTKDPFGTVNAGPVQADGAGVVSLTCPTTIKPAPATSG